jgi:hypothetical protein
VESKENKSLQTPRDWKLKIQTIIGTKTIMGGEQL